MARPLLPLPLPLPLPRHRHRATAAAGAVLITAGLVVSLVSLFGHASRKVWLQPVPWLQAEVMACDRQGHGAAREACMDALRDEVRLRADPSRRLAQRDVSTGADAPAHDATARH
jgi:hypothetical protein